MERLSRCRHPIRPTRLHSPFDFRKRAQDAGATSLYKSRPLPRHDRGSGSSGKRNGNQPRPNSFELLARQRVIQPRTRHTPASQPHYACAVHVTSANRSPRLRSLRLRYLSRSVCFQRRIEQSQMAKAREEIQMRVLWLPTTSVRTSSRPRSAPEKHTQPRGRKHLLTRSVPWQDVHQERQLPAPSTRHSWGKPS